MGLKVLHITTWFPNSDQPKEALWIENQIKSIQAHTKQNDILHIQVKPGKRIRKIKPLKTSGLDQTIYEIPTKKWRIIEITTFLILFIKLIKIKKARHYDIVNFHIAYPILVYWKLIKKLVIPPVIITEHWSAYHLKFGLKHKIPRIQNIFRHSIPVITVSHALRKDIQNYTEANFECFIVPNVVDEACFYPSVKDQRKKYFFMVSLWKYPKQPLIAIKSFMQLSKKFPEYTLKIGGYGPQLKTIENWIAENNAGHRIQVLGSLTPEEIGNEMRQCAALLHPSDYETFSVVCAEAIACECPVIASNKGGIPEVVGNGGILVDCNTISAWCNAISDFFVNKNLEFEAKKFRSNKVGEKYIQALKDTINASKR